MQTGGIASARWGVQGRRAIPVIEPSTEKLMRERDEVLDLVRGVSAMIVLLAHVRGFVLVDYGEVEGAGAFTRAFYFATGVHHEAVMVFFVLSGYFVGGSVLESLREGRFRPANYALARLSRLWVVLIPALLLTLGMDFAGMRLNPGAYVGAYREAFMSGPGAVGGSDLSGVAFVGNLLFLQTVEVPVYGSNGPLWSLANEFWYYVLFPLGVCGCCGGWKGSGKGLRGPVMRLGMVMVFVGIAVWLPRHLVIQGLIWLFGVGVWMVTRKAAVLAASRSWWWKLGGAVLFCGTLAASKMSGNFGSDFAVGLAFAVWMPALVGAWSRRGWWEAAGGGLSAVSYTLYVVHFPVLFFVVSVWLRGQQFQPDLRGMGWFGGLSLVSVAVGTVMWWIFERRTDSVRRWAGERLGIRGGRKMTDPEKALMRPTGGRPD
jgi:peptidoglycan/LPS O-acetylase OafA/YrhL